MEAVVSIYSQVMQNHITSNHSSFRAKFPATLRRYLQGYDAVQLAFAADFPPCAVIRQLLQEILGLSRQAVMQVLRDPQLLLTWSHEASGKEAETAGETEGASSACVIGPDDEGAAAERRAWDDAALIGRLLKDTIACCDADWMGSPSSDAVRHVRGLEAEAELCASLETDDVAYWSEEGLRESGFIKTPDVRLQIPIKIRGVTIFWIDSKATFGDERQHHTQLVAQYRKYLNRYGCGAVVYWEGFVDDLSRPALEEGLLLLDGCPSGGLRLDRLAAAEGNGLGAPSLELNSDCLL